MVLRLRSVLKAVKRDYSYLVRNNGFFASFRLSSKDTSFKVTFSSISSKCSSTVFFCKLERCSSSVKKRLDFLTLELNGYLPLLCLEPPYTICNCKILKIVIARVQQHVARLWMEQPLMCSITVFYSTA